MMPVGCLSLLLMAVFAILMPFFLADAIVGALGKLGLGTGLSIAVLAGMLVGGLVNVPLKKIPRVMSFDETPPALFGLGRLFPNLYRPAPYTIIAVNVGGCVIPLALAVYELGRIAAHGGSALLLTALSVAINTAVCRRIARPVPNVGIALPALVPALVAAACGMLLVRDFAPPVAFVAGVLGTLIGADLLHLRQVGAISTGMASIGGAGTFDGIVLSGLVATLLA